MERQDRPNSNGKRKVTIHADYREKGRSDGRVLQEWQLRGCPASMTSFGGTSRDKSKHGSWQKLHESWRCGCRALPSRRTLQQGQYKGAFAQARWDTASRGRDLELTRWRRPKRRVHDVGVERGVVVRIGQLRRLWGVVGRDGTS